MGRARNQTAAVGSELFTQVMGSQRGADRPEMEMAKLKLVAHRFEPGIIGLYSNDKLVHDGPVFMLDFHELLTRLDFPHGYLKPSEDWVYETEEIAPVKLSDIPSAGGQGLTQEWVIFDLVSCDGFALYRNGQLYNEWELPAVPVADVLRAFGFDITSYGQAQPGTCDGPVPKTMPNWFAEIDVDPPAETPVAP